MSAPLDRFSACLLVATCVLAGCRTVEDMQRDYAKKITPQGVEAAPVADTVAEKPLRPMKVRVWVDGDYQRQTLRWEDRIAAQFERANRVLIPQFGVRLDVVEIKPWENTPADSLDTHLRALLARDDGQGVGGGVRLVGRARGHLARPDRLGGSVRQAPGACGAWCPSPRPTPSTSRWTSSRPRSSTG